MTPEPSTIDPDALGHTCGALLGLAVGDAVGTTVEFVPRGSFPPVTDMVGGGPFGLEAGRWTDDTSMALCLAESLLADSGLSVRNLMGRFDRWVTQGHNSSTGGPATPSPATRAPARPGTARSCGWRRSRSGGGATPARPRTSPAGRA
jgi:ADP-ribosylglycohydrolase